MIAWHAYLVVMNIPKFGKGHDWRSSARTLDAFMRRFPPPGYSPERTRKSE